MPIRLVFVLFICITLFIASSGSDSLQLSNDSFKLSLRANLKRRDHLSTLTLAERLKSAVERSQRRARNIAADIRKAYNETAIETLVRAGLDGEFLVELGVGTPAVTFQGLADTGSDLVWTQCRRCQVCYKQPTPIFDPSKSSTYSRVGCKEALCKGLLAFKTPCTPDCTYEYSYDAGGFSLGDLSRETITFGDGARVPSIAFGCGHNNQRIPHDIGGIVGLGRGALSLISQLGERVDNMFSYCLLPVTEPPSKTSPMFFGSAAGFTGGHTLRGPDNHHLDTFWYVPLTGLTVAGKAVDIPPDALAVQRDGSGGVILDSGTALTVLVREAYRPLLSAVRSAVKLTPVRSPSRLFDLCYRRSSSGHGARLRLPSFAFNFAGGVDMKLPVENYFVQADDNHVCLAVARIDDPPSIIGSIQQQNFQFLFDNANSRISFRPAKCDSL